MQKIKSLVLSGLALLACFTAAASAQSKIEIIPDVVYGHKDGMALTMDVVKPMANANHAAVVFMVSGGWVSAYVPPQQFAERQPFKELLEKGYTVIALRHGGSPKYVIPDIVSDVRR